MNTELLQFKVIAVKRYAHEHGGFHWVGVIADSEGKRHIVTRGQGNGAWRHMTGDGRYAFLLHQVAEELQREVKRIERKEARSA